MALDLQDREGGFVLALYVKPRSSRDAIEGEREGALVVRLTAPPVEGEANAALARVLGGALAVPPSAVRLLSGATGRRKRAFVSGVTAAEARSRLEAAGSKSQR